MRALEKEYTGRFHYLRLAVTKADGEITFHETLDNESGSIFNDHKNILVDKIRSYKVESVSLKGLPAKIGAKMVDYIKLDLEGAEYELLSKVTEYELKAFKQIFVEFHHRAIKHYSINDTKKIVNSLCNKGFHAHTLDEHNYLFLNN